MTTFPTIPETTFARIPGWSDLTSGQQDQLRSEITKQIAPGLMGQELEDSVLLIGQDEIEELRARGGGGKPKLSDPQGGGDQDKAIVTLASLGANPVSIQSLARVLFESNLENRKAAREDRAQQRDLNMQAQQNAADKIREAANFAFAGAMVQGVVTIASAAINIGAQAAAAKQVKLSQSAEKTAMKLENQSETLKLGSKMTVQNADKVELGETRSTMQRNAVAKLEEAQEVRVRANDARTEAASKAKYADKLAQGGIATGQIGQGLGTIGGQAFRTFGEASAEEDKAKEQAQATKTQAAAEDQGEFMRAYEEAMRKVLDTLVAAQQAEADTNRTIIRG
jgi:hypothetical protein